MNLTIEHAIHPATSRNAALAANEALDNYFARIDASVHLMYAAARSDEEGYQTKMEAFLHMLLDMTQEARKNFETWKAWQDERPDDAGGRA